MNRWWLNARVERFQKETCRKPKSVSWEERKRWKAEETVIFVSHIRSVCHDPVSMKQCPPLVLIGLTDPLYEVTFTGVCVSLWGKVCLLYICIGVSADQLNKIFCSVLFPSNYDHFHNLFQITVLIGKMFIGSILLLFTYFEPLFVCLYSVMRPVFHLITVQMGIKATWLIWQMELFSNLFKRHFDSVKLKMVVFLYFTSVQLACVHIRCVLLLLFICCQMSSLKFNFEVKFKLANLNAHSVLLQLCCM